MNIVIQKWTSISFIVKKKRKTKEITQNICTFLADTEIKSFRFLQTNSLFVMVIQELKFRNS